jgi:hypothetical protein
MEDEITVKYGDIDDQKILKLLKSVRSAWGDIDYLKWTYYEEPSSDENENYYAINMKNNDQIVGFRRASIKYVVFLNEGHTEKMLEWKHGSVHPEYQGLGVFSKIRDSEYCIFMEKQYSYKIAFVRKTNIPFKMHKRQGWNHISLPYHMYIISPKKIIEEYVTFLEEKSEKIPLLAKLFGKRINFVVSDGELNISSTFGGDSSKGFKLKIYVSNNTLVNNVENFACNWDAKKMLKDNLKSFLKGEIGPFPVNERYDDEISDIGQVGLKVDRIEVTENFHPENLPNLDSIKYLYDRFLEDYDITFRRNYEDLLHILKYPRNTDIISIYRNEKLVGFAVLGGAIEKSNKEMWVMDMVYKDKNVFKKLVSIIKIIGFERNMNSIVIYSDQNPGDDWAHMPMMSLMWKGSAEGFEEKLKNAKWKVSQYDLL